MDLGMDNSRFLTNSYYSKLDDFIREKPLTTPSIALEKSEKIQSALKKAKLFDVEGPLCSNFYKEVHEAIRTISLIKPGRKLLKLFLIHLKDSHLKICESPIDFFDTDNKIINISSKVHTYYIGREQKLHKFRLEASLVHELIHAIHFYENSETMLKRTFHSKPSQLFHVNFQNLEEQLTICGLLEEKGEITLCENAFLRAWGLELRVNHFGLQLSEAYPTTLRLDHYIIATALGSVAEYLAENSKAVNLLYYLDWLPETKVFENIALKKLYPLSIAIALGNTEIIDHLIQCGSLPDLIDEEGGPILMACHYNDFSLALKLIAIAQQKNRSLNTEFLLQRLIENAKYDYEVNDEFCEILWMLHQQQKQGSLHKKLNSLLQRILRADFRGHRAIKVLNWLTKKETSEASYEKQKIIQIFC